MNLEKLAAQENLFAKYWQSGSENGSIKDLRTADQLREKMIPQLESLGSEADEDLRIILSETYSWFAEFLFEYFLALVEAEGNPSAAHRNLASMAERAIDFNPSSFAGHYYLALHQSWNLTSAHAGDLPAVHEGSEIGESIVGTAFNLFVKGVTLGATATSAGIARSKFNASIKDMIVAYEKNTRQAPVDVNHYLTMTYGMLHMADYCEDINNPMCRSIYSAVKAFDPNRLDFSGLEGDAVSEAEQTVMEFWILADSKL